MGSLRTWNLAEHAGPTPRAAWAALTRIKILHVMGKSSPTRRELGTNSASVWVASFCNLAFMKYGIQTGDGDMRESVGTITAAA